jgi:hypothetical protein
MSSDAAKKVLNAEDRAIFMQALESFWKMGESEVQCDVCSAPIRFERVGSAIRHSCDCGKFNGSLRGL